MSPDEQRAIEWECHRLINLYAELNDEGRWEELASLYVPDGVMARPSAPDAPIGGREAILSSFLARPARYTRHICANILVDVESSHFARGRSRILLFTGEAGPGEKLPRQSGTPLVGQYRDRFVRTADGWRFSERLGSLSFQP